MVVEEKSEIKSNYLYCSTTGVLVWYYINLTKIGPSPVLNEVVAKGAFLSKVRLPIYATVHALMLTL